MTSFGFVRGCPAKSKDHASRTSADSVAAHLVWRFTCLRLITHGGMASETVRVVVRCRPLNAKELESGRRDIVQVGTTGRELALVPNDPGSAPRNFTFDQVSERSFRPLDSLGGQGGFSSCMLNWRTRKEGGGAVSLSVHAPVEFGPLMHPSKPTGAAHLQQPPNPHRTHSNPVPHIHTSQLYPTTTTHRPPPQVFDQAAGQQKVYDGIARPILECVLKGFNGTVFCYGVCVSATVCACMRLRVRVCAQVLQRHTFLLVGVWLGDCWESGGGKVKDAGKA